VRDFLTLPGREETGAAHQVQAPRRDDNGCDQHDRGPRGDKFFSLVSEYADNSPDGICGHQQAQISIKFKNMRIFNIF
jgi:hypothetical protein